MDFCDISHLAGENLIRSSFTQPCEEFIAVGTTYNNLDFLGIMFCQMRNIFSSRFELLLPLHKLRRGLKGFL